MGLLYLTIIYRLVGYLLVVKNDFGLHFDFFDEIYFNESVWIFSLLSAFGFLLLAILIPVLYYKYLSDKTLLTIAFGGLIPYFLPYIVLFGCTNKVVKILVYLGAIGLIAYIFVTIILIKNDLKTEKKPPDFLK